MSNLQFLFANLAQTQLASPITSTATTLTVSPGTGALFPAPGAGQQFALSLLDAATRTHNEIVYVTARTADTMTVVRGQEGTTAQSWLAGDLASNNCTAGQMGSFAQSGNRGTFNQQNGASYTYQASDAGGTVLRGNAGIMVDTLPVFPAGSTLTIVNNSAGASGVLALVPPSGGAVYSPQWGYGGVGHQALYLTFGQSCELYTTGAGGWVSINAPSRMRLEDGLTIYAAVSTGNALNHGLLSSAPKTLVDALAMATAIVDAGGQQITVQLTAESFIGNFVVTGGIVGQSLPTLNYGENGAGGATAPPLSQMGALIIQGPASGTAIISCSSGAAALRCGGQSCVVINGAVQFATTGSSPTPFGLLVDPGAAVAIGNGVIFSATSNYQIWTSGVLYLAGNYSIVGGSTGGGHMLINGSGARANYSPITVTLTGTPSFSAAIFNASNDGNIYVENAIFSGSATGQRYGVFLNGVINTNGGGASFLPGSTSGTTGSGGEYA